MKVRCAVLLGCMLASLTPGFGGTSRSGQQNSPTGSEDSRFAAMAERFMKNSLALSPVGASQAGYHQHPDPETGKMIELDARLDDLSPRGFDLERDFYREWQGRFRAVDRAKLDPEDAADWQLVDDQIALNLLELERIQSYRHNPTVYVELLGDAMFLPMTQSYASSEVRLGDVLSRVEQIPRALTQARLSLSDSDPVYTEAAVEENGGNIDLIRTTLKEQIPPGSRLEARYARAAPAAIEALEEFSGWMRDDLSKRPTSRSWRLGSDFYADKFRLVMETPVTPGQILEGALREMKSVRAEMLSLALPMHQQMYPGHADHSELGEEERENLVITEVLSRISDDHVEAGQLLDHIKADVNGITQFIRDKKIVGLSDRNNLKVIPTPVFMRESFSVAGFHSAPPLEPSAEAQYWVTPIDPNAPKSRVESKLREYNNYTLKWLTIHEALPGHYIQFEHADGVQPESRRLLRSLFSNGAYVEGWAEYIAQVMMDEGYLDYDPRFRLVMRKIRLRLLSNVILDVRMHTGNMTDQEAMELMTKEAFQTRAEAEGKLRRAKLSSVQLPTLRRPARLARPAPRLPGPHGNEIQPGRVPQPRTR